MTAHLGEERYRRLISGDLPRAEARALAEHLEGECAECEAFLAQRAEVDALDGRVDRALVALGAGAAEGAERGNDLEYRRIERRLAAERKGAARVRRPAWSSAAGIAAAAVLVVAGLAGVEVAGHLESGRWDGEKGASALVPVRLAVLAEHGGALEKVVSGQRLPAAARLRFAVRLGGPAEVALIHAQGSGAAEILLRRRYGAGENPIYVDGKPAALALEDLRGPQRFVAVASRDGLDERRLLAAAGLAPAARAGPPDQEGITMDAVEILVE